MITYLTILLCANIVTNSGQETFITPPKQPDSHLTAVQGTWEMMRFATDGLGFGKADAKNGLGIFVHINGSEMTVLHSNKPHETYQVSVSTEQRTQKFDLTHNDQDKKITEKGIFQLEGELLKCHLTGPNQARPQNFEKPWKKDQREIILKRASLNPV